MGSYSSKCGEKKYNTKIQLCTKDKKVEDRYRKSGETCSKQRPCVQGFVCSEKQKDKKGNKTCQPQQKGKGINYQEKYQKYKSKYLDLKEKNNL
jgi:hypothetical protein